MLDAAAVLRHPSFVALGRRVRRRRLVVWLRVGALCAAGGAALLILVARLGGYTEWAAPAACWGALALGAALLGAFLARPDHWAVARAADQLGLH